MNQTKNSTGDDNSKPAKTGSITAVPEWLNETINGGSFPLVDLHTGTNGWASPPPDGFSLRSADYFKNKQKSPGGSYLLSPAGVDWLRSTAKLHNIMARPDNRVAHALRKAQARGESLKSFIFAVNYMIPGKDGQYNLVYYFATEEPIQPGSVLDRFISGDDSYRNQRFKLVSQVVKGPWVVKQASAKFGAMHLGKAVKCSYHKGSNYFEMEVDVGSSAIMVAFFRLVLGYASSLKSDVGFVLEAQAEDELPERLIGAVRICGMELSHAFVVDPEKPRRMMGSVIADHEEVVSPSPSGKV